MFHDNVICKGCGTAFSYESRSRKPKSVCSPKCQEAVRVYTPEQRALRVQQVKKWREDNPELNKAKRRQFYEANTERLIADSKRWYDNNSKRALERHRNYRLDNHDKLIARGRDFYAKNSERINEEKRRKRAESPDLARQKDRDWWAENGETVRARNRERYRTDAEYRRKSLEAIKVWRDRYPEKAREKGLRDSHIRKARFRDVEYEVFSFREIYDRDQWRCHICERVVAKHRSWPDPWSASLDHVVPLSRGGGHTRENVKLSHLHCNLAKGDRDIE